jgi:hypothetical protein
MSTILDDLVDLWVRGAAEAAFVDDGNLGDLGGLLALHSGRIPSSPAAVFDDHDLVEATHAPLPVPRARRRNSHSRDGPAKA